ncbi:hypothetical protein ACTFIT_003308 [Dictyostelium discoideum]
MGVENCTFMLSLLQQELKIRDLLPSYLWVKDHHRPEKPGRTTYRINQTHRYRQLGLDKEWLRDALQNSGVKIKEADRDFFNRWTSGSLRSPLSTELNNIIRDYERDPLWTEFQRRLQDAIGLVFTYIRDMVTVDAGGCIDPFKHIFNWIVEEVKVDKNAAAMVNNPLRPRGSYFYDDVRNKFGFVTTAESR